MPAKRNASSDAAAKVKPKAKAKQQSTAPAAGDATSLVAAAASHEEHKKLHSALTYVAKNDTPEMIAAKQEAHLNTT